MPNPSPPETAARRLGRLLDAGALVVMPCCFDALSGRLARCSGPSGRL